MNRPNGLAIGGALCEECQNGVLVSSADAPIPGTCNKCEGGVEVELSNGTCSTDSSSCCVNGVKRQKNPMIVVDFKYVDEFCPNREDNPNMGKGTDGCSVPPELLGTVSSANDPMGDGSSSFLPACTAHDRCYGTCSRDGEVHRSGCDTSFARAMEVICEKTYPESEVRKLEDCIIYRTAYYFAVSQWGHKDEYYPTRQRLGCDCCGPALAQ